MKKRLDFFVRMGMFVVVHYVDLLERLPLSRYNAPLGNVALCLRAFR